MIRIPSADPYLVDNNKLDLGFYKKTRSKKLVITYNMKLTNRNFENVSHNGRWFVYGG